MSRKVLHRVFAAVFVLMAAAATTGLAAQPLQTLRLNTFPNATNLALYIGIANGVFEYDIRGYEVAFAAEGLEALQA